MFSLFAIHEASLHIPRKASLLSVKKIEISSHLGPYHHDITNKLILGLKLFSRFLRARTQVALIEAENHENNNRDMKLEKFIRVVLHRHIIYYNS